MKKKFSTQWIGSKQVRKQRKYLENAPLHILHKLISAHLSKELRQKYGQRSLELRKGDTVKIMNGEFKGKSGKVSIVKLKKRKVSIEGIQKQKKDGTKVNLFFFPSNLMIQELILDDKKRLALLSKKIKPTETEKIVKTETKKDTEKQGENKNAHNKK